MDYSLLLGIAERQSGIVKEPLHIMNEKNMRIIPSKLNGYIYFASIIDIFQKYNISKKIERSFKSIKLSARKANMISSIPPKPYADRFFHFMIANVFQITK